MWAHVIWIWIIVARSRSAGGYHSDVSTEQSGNGAKRAKKWWVGVERWSDITENAGAERRAGALSVNSAAQCSADSGPDYSVRPQHACCGTTADVDAVADLWSKSVDWIDWKFLDPMFDLGQKIRKQLNLTLTLNPNPKPINSDPKRCTVVFGN